MRNEFFSAATSQLHHITYWIFYSWLYYFHVAIAPPVIELLYNWTKTHKKISKLRKVNAHYFLFFFFCIIALLHYSTISVSYEYSNRKHPIDFRCASRIVITFRCYCGHTRLTPCMHCKSLWIFATRIRPIFLFSTSGRSQPKCSRCGCVFCIVTCLTNN